MPWQFTVSLNGFVAVPNHAMNWMTGICVPPGPRRGAHRDDRAVLGGRGDFDAYSDVSGIYGGA